MSCHRFEVIIWVPLKPWVYEGQTCVTPRQWLLVLLNRFGDTETLISLPMRSWTFFTCTFFDGPWKSVFFFICRDFGLNFFGGAMHGDQTANGNLPMPIWNMFLQMIYFPWPVLFLPRVAGVNWSCGNLYSEYQNPPEMPNPRSNKKKQSSQHHIWKKHGVSSQKLDVRCNIISSLATRFQLIFHRKTWTPLPGIPRDPPMNLLKCQVRGVWCVHFWSEPEPKGWRCWDSEPTRDGGLGGIQVDGWLLTSKSWWLFFFANFLVPKSHIIIIIVIIYSFIYLFIYLVV